MTLALCTQGVFGIDANADESVTKKKTPVEVVFETTKGNGTYLSSKLPRPLWNSLQLCHGIHGNHGNKR